LWLRPQNVVNSTNMLRPGAGGEADSQIVARLGLRFAEACSISPYIHAFAHPFTDMISDHFRANVGHRNIQRTVRYIELSPTMIDNAALARSSRPSSGQVAPNWRDCWRGSCLCNGLLGLPEPFRRLCLCRQNSVSRQQSRRDAVRLCDY
jgi:hypothetical protein